jgi:hypothetical protein
MHDGDLSRGVFWLSGTLLVFGCGVAVGRYEMFPYAWIKFGQDALFQVFEDRGMITRTRPTGHLYPSRYPGAGVTRSETDRSTPDFTFMSGFFGDRPEMRLIRRDGSVVNRWYVPLAQAFPDQTHILPPGRRPQSEWNIQLHGALALPDGSVVFNMSYIGMVKLDRCSKIEWTVPLMTHHTVEPSADGGFWAPGEHFVETGSAYLPVRAPYLEDTLVKVSADGEVEREISVPALIYGNPVVRSAYLANGLEIIGNSRDMGAGITELVHVNDVEELSNEMADRFRLFEAGDLLVSLRNQHLLMVVDPRALAIKWFQVGPWIRQHDPDFTTRGTISVFNNNLDMTRTGTVLGGSNIVEIDPVTRETRIVYGSKRDQPLYSGSLGKHQHLGPGGEHLLITEPEGGRVLQVDGDGNIVWEFINRFDDQAVARVSEALRYPEDYFAMDDWTCP